LECDSEEKRGKAKFKLSTVYIVDKEDNRRGKLRLEILNIDIRYFYEMLAYNYST